MAIIAEIKTDDGKLLGLMLLIGSKKANRAAEAD